MLKKQILILGLFCIFNSSKSLTANDYKKCERKYTTTLMIDGKPVVVKSCSDLTPHSEEIQKALVKKPDGSYDWRAFEAVYTAARIGQTKNNRTKIAIAFGAGALISAGVVLAKVSDYLSGMMDR